MKTILVLTDFSENAAHAAKSAVMLSEKLDTNLLLFNTYINAPVIPQYGGGPWVVDEIMQWENESKGKLHKLAEHLDPVIAKLNPQKHKPTVHCQAGEGNLGENVDEIILQTDIELIVMGSRSSSSIDHILNGSDTSSVINQASRPVLVIPPKSELKNLKKIIYATDFDDGEIKAVQYLVKLGKLFEFQLEIVHVSILEKNDTLKTEREVAFVKQVTRLKYPYLTYKVIRGKDVINRLNRLFDESGADLLALVHYQNSFFMRVLQQSTTKDIMSNQKMPLLVFPSKME